MQTNKLYVEIASTLTSLANCEQIPNHNWAPIWTQRLKDLLEYMPNGSGFDTGTEIDRSASNGKLVFTTSFHHMNDVGFYDGWTDHRVTVEPHLVHGFTLRISGKNRNGIKDYIHDVFSGCLNTTVAINDDLTVTAID